jgi:hypothetical protein
MKRQVFISLFTVLLLSFCKTSQEGRSKKISILKIEMHLSAYGVESDNFPSIEAFVDFTKGSSNCVKSYYNPAFKGSSYKLSNDEINKVLLLLQSSDLYKLKKEYKVNKTDQPTSTLTIYTNQQIFTIKDYGLEGDYPLQNLYKTIYKL